jgi:hypothetical protein
VQAKITQEAALRRAEKARKEAEGPKLVLEAAYADLEAKMQDAVDQLELAKRAGGRAHGSLFWMERDLFEADKSLPRAKQRYDHSKGFVVRSVFLLGICAISPEIAHADAYFLFLFLLLLLLLLLLLFPTDARSTQRTNFAQRRPVLRK